MRTNFIDMPVINNIGTAKICFSAVKLPLSSFPFALVLISGCPPYTILKSDEQITHQANVLPMN